MSIYPPKPPTDFSGNKKIRNIGLIVIAIVVAVVVIISILLASGVFFPNTSNDSNGNNDLPAQQTGGIFTGSMTVNANDYSYVSILVPMYASNAYVRGNFKVSGGSGEGIKVYIMSQTNYFDWQNGSQVYTYYSTDKVTAGYIDIDVQFGIYYIVFDNTYSPSYKTVSGEINLIYTKTPVSS
jgi:hypothetical protein